MKHQMTSRANVPCTPACTAPRRRGCNGEELQHNRDGRRMPQKPDGPKRSSNWGHRASSQHVVPWVSDAGASMSIKIVCTNMKGTASKSFRICCGLSPKAEVAGWAEALQQLGPTCELHYHMLAMGLRRW